MTLRLLFITFAEIKMIKTLTKITVESANSVGLTPTFTWLYMNVEIVLMPIPLVKWVMTKSSIDIVNESKNPDNIPGITSGRTTFMKALNELAPRSRAASSVIRTLLLNRGFMDKNAKGRQNTM